MKKKIFCLSLILIFILSGCAKIETSDTYVKQEQPHLYWKDIECEVLNINYRHWYASAHHYTADLTVFSEEYNLKETFHLTGADAQECESIKKGDIISCELQSWVLDSTGEITKRIISHIN